LITALCAGIALIPLTLSAGKPGKEILYPVATVIVGGLISSTLLDFLARPALFWIFGISAARHVVEAQEHHIPLVEQDEATVLEASDS
jgi:Cu/Ag efflux pump CusA